LTEFTHKLQLALHTWTKAGIERRSGIATSTIRYWLAGKGQPEPASIRALRKIGVRI
jgi:hypothetical protein